MRVARIDPEAALQRTQAVLDLHALTDPETRLPHSLVMDMLDRAIVASGDASLGLRAGENLEPGDMGPLEYAARSCATLRSALECLQRYIGLVNDAVAVTLDEQGSTAAFRFRARDGIVQHPAADDFQLAASVTVSKRLTGTDPALLEVHFMRPQPELLSDYQRVFACSLRFGMADNVLVFRREHLNTPLVQQNPGLSAAYALHAEEQLKRLEGSKGTTGLAREVVLAQLRAGDVGVQTVARRLSMSPATLRRRLGREGTTLSDLVDGVRQDLAVKYLKDETLSIGEVAFLLGFAHVPGFYKAFQRWHPGRTPADFRRGASTDRRKGRRGPPSGG